MHRSIFLLLTLSVFSLQAQIQGTREDAVRILINAFADARNAHDGDSVAALYSEDGEWLQNHGTAVVRGRAALSRLWGSATGHVDRTISSIEFPGPNIAVVRVSTEYGPPIGNHAEVFVLVTEDTKSLTNWRIHIHQTLD